MADPTDTESPAESNERWNAAQVGNELSVARDEANTLLKAIKARAKAADVQGDSIQQAHASALSASEQLSTDLAASRAQLAELEQLAAAAAQTDAALATLHTSAAASAQNAEDAEQRASAALDTIAAANERVATLTEEVVGVRTQMEETATTVAAKSAHIEEGRLHADSVRAALDSTVAKSKDAEEATAAALETVRTKVNELATLQATALGTKATIDTIGEAVTAVRTQSETHMNATKRIAEIAEAVEAKVKAYEARLEELQRTADERLATIETLLPSATSAGLAHAFDRRGKTFQWPSRIWQGAFIGALACLFVLAAVEAHLAGGGIPQYTELARRLLNRLPFLVPLVWLAIHAARQASLAKRMEENYAFKATMSASFEGYRRELAAIEGDVTAGSPLATLCNETLRTIGAPPGQIYDRHRMDPTPGTAAAEFVAPVVEGVARALEKFPALKG
jgi:predicted  nucleic acid-binding Zn-ribbon protein